MYYFIFSNKLKNSKMSFHSSDARVAFLFVNYSSAILPLTVQFILFKSKSMVIRIGKRRKNSV